MVEEVVKDGLRQYVKTQGKSWSEDLEQNKRLKPDLLLSTYQEKKRESAEENGGKNNLDGINEVDSQITLDHSSVETIMECLRPWWVAQPYVRPLPKEALAKGSWALSKRELKEAAQKLRT
ncbi:putative trna-dihydrouridine synthase c [Erysiphe necator]|uniref:Putative trna-dihydrouridine synthase c n=1 Tax=Uncinula necator TaxID=52586 RepID=A0A0B1NWZ6_UNCNE|nr:putative trna-dihydrouridine synthase c [Erysiphe necator]